MVTPVKVWLGPVGFVPHVQSNIDALPKQPVDSAPSPELHNALRLVELARCDGISPAESLIEPLHPWVAFAIMPVFALANAGVALGGLAFDGTTTKFVLAVGVGLVLSKPIGVLLAGQLTLHLKVASLPLGITLRYLVVLGTVAGIGFTMALFVAQLAFTDAQLLGAAKLGVPVASDVAAVDGLLIGWIWLKAAQPDRCFLRTECEQPCTPFIDVAATLMSLPRSPLVSHSSLVPSRLLPCSSTRPSSTQKSTTRRSTTGIGPDTPRMMEPFDVAHDTADGATRAGVVLPLCPVSLAELTPAPPASTCQPPPGSPRRA